MSETINANTDFERSDVSVHALGWLLAAIVACGIALHFGLSFLYGIFSVDFAASGRETEVRDRKTPASAAPQLLVVPETDIDQLRRTEEQKLRTYGWVDKDKGIIHIPIDQAMKMIAERGGAETKPAGQQVQETK
ncbi:MAG: hypothetical protein IT174_10475 [Acidobacteria bacterium]|nr:hypothetical protein [Acidobacteriota bacterium]